MAVRIVRMGEKSGIGSRSHDHEKLYVDTTPDKAGIVFSFRMNGPGNGASVYSVKFGPDEYDALMERMVELDRDATIAAFKRATIKAVD